MVAKMRDEEEAQNPQTTPTGSSSGITLAASLSIKKDGCGFQGLFGRGRYKLWALAAILFLALWSMFSVSADLKWSSVKQSEHHLSSSVHGDLDILDVDEKEKMVRQMWNVYKHSGIVKLPNFWQDAFGAAYQDLTSEVASVRNSALLEIAKMSLWSRDVYDAPPVQSTARESEEVRPRKMGKTRKDK